MKDATPVNSGTAAREGKANPDRQSSFLNKAGPSFSAVLLSAFLLILTRPTTLGDTSVYAKDIAQNLGRFPWGVGGTLWEFGHLLWRPVGLALVSLLSPVLSRLTDWTPFMQACFVLIALSVLSSVITVVLWYRLLLDESGSEKTAIALTLAFACCHAVLLYSHSGCAYIPGFACLTAAISFLRGDKVGVAAMFYAIAALFWLPYILAGPALFVLAASPHWDLPVRDNLAAIRPGKAIVFTAIGLGVITVAYCLAGAARGITSSAEALTWYHSASHNLSGNNRLARLATGLPRTFFFMDKDGILLKRYLKHDPYASIDLAYLLRVILWKLALFYAFLLGLGVELWRRRSTLSWGIAVLLAVAAPVVFFAVFLFEPGAPERYLPILAFLVPITGRVFCGFTQGPTKAQWIMAGVLLAFSFNNLYYFSAPRVNSEDAASWSRIAQLRDRLRGSSIAMVTTNQDRLEEYLTRSPFGAVNRPEIFRVYDIVEPGSTRMFQWREEFADQVFTVWNKGGEVWISKRLFSPTPDSEWNWVERDDPLEIWTDLSAFFRPLATDMVLGGVDGFVRLTQNENNLQYLKPIAAAYKEQVGTASPRSNHP